MANITVNQLGTLRYTANTTSARTFILNGGTLDVSGGATLTLNGATVGGGFMRGAGTFALTSGTALSGVTTFGTTTLNQTGQAALTNFTSGGTLTNAAATTLTWNGGLNQSAGLFTVNGTAEVNDWSSNGILTDQRRRRASTTAGRTWFSVVAAERQSTLAVRSICLAERRSS